LQNIKGFTFLGCLLFVSVSYRCTNKIDPKMSPNSILKLQWFQSRKFEFWCARPTCTDVAKSDASQQKCVKIVKNGLRDKASATANRQ